eukprot:4779753-Alexandrium_andersonii.AAC.1
MVPPRALAGTPSAPPNSAGAQGERQVVSTKRTSMRKASEPGCVTFGEWASGKPGFARQGSQQ